MRIVRIAVSAALISYLLLKVPLKDVGRALLGARPIWLAVAFTLVGATNLLAALQMRSILAVQGMRFTLRQISAINLVTKFYGLFLPGYLAGGVIRWNHFSGPEGKRAQAFAAMLFSREVELLTTIGFGVVFYRLAHTALTARATFTTLAIALAGAVLLVLLSVNERAHRILLTGLARLPLPRRLQQSAVKISDCLVDFGRQGRGHHLPFLALCIVRNAIGVAAFVCFARALTVTAPAMDLGWIRALLDLVAILPVSLAGIGVRDASLVALLVPMGVTSGAALALSLLLLGRTLIVALIGGIVEGARVYSGMQPGFISGRGR